MFFATRYVLLVKFDVVPKVESDDRALLRYRKSKLLIVVARQHPRAVRGRYIKSITSQLCGKTR